MSLISYRALHMARVLTSTFSPLNSLARKGLRNYRSISCRRKLCFSHLIRRTMAYSTYDSGAPNSLEYRMYFRKYSQNLKNMGSPFASSFTRRKSIELTRFVIINLAILDTEDLKENDSWYLVEIEYM